MTFLSKEAEAKNRASGEKAIWLTACWCPIKIIKKSLSEKYMNQGYYEIYDKWRRIKIEWVNIYKMKTSKKNEIRKWWNIK